MMEHRGRRSHAPLSSEGERLLVLSAKVAECRAKLSQFDAIEQELEAAQTEIEKILGSAQAKKDRK